MTDDEIDKLVEDYMAMLNDNAGNEENIKGILLCMVKEIKAKCEATHTVVIK